MKQILLSFILLPTLSFAHFHFEGANNQNLLNTISTEQIETLINRFHLEFSQEVSERGGRLVIEYQEQNPAISAFAAREGLDWKITLNGGMGRHKEINLENLAGILCHELGHHLGGSPKKNRDVLSHWSSVEGQADYFVSTKCLRRMWGKEVSRPLDETKIPSTLKKACKETSHLEMGLCLRIGIVSWQMARLAAMLSPREVTPQFDRPTKLEVKRTLETHPSPQCRLDTYFQGLLCPVSEQEAFSDDSPITGSCHHDLGHQKGFRTKCWYVN